MTVALSDTLVGKTSTERSQLKAAAIRDVVDAAITAAASKKKTYSFALKDGRMVKVEAVRLGVLSWVGGVATFTQRTDGGADPVWVKVSVDSVYLNGDGWYGFVNPPILVPDGTLTDGAANFKEDLVVAAKTIVARAVGGEV